ncbi:hypothetical protein LTR95_016418 [Oleoguttula sp. CCFEE 5521]
MKTNKFAYLKRDAKAAGWQASLPLGSGSQGCVSVWIKTNANGKISERKAVKDNYDTDWEKCYPLKQLSGEEDLPMELGVLYALKHAKANAPAGSIIIASGLVNDPTPNILTHKVDKVLNLARCHLEYCPYGDLAEVMATHLEDGGGFPEPFLWCLFSCLADAALLLQQGHLQRTLQGPFSSNKYPLYPVPKLADFGTAYVIDPAEDATGLESRGTRNYLAPEQNGHDSMPLCTHTNIYGIGITLMALMNLDRETGRDIDWDRDRKPVFDDTAKLYTESLGELVSQCIYFDVQDRISLENLRARLEEHTAPGDEDKSSGFRRMTAEQVHSWRNGPHDLNVRPDPYRLRMSFDVSSDEESGDGEPMTDDEEESEQGEEPTEGSEETDDESMED